MGKPTAWTLITINVTILSACQTRFSFCLFVLFFGYDNNKSPERLQRHKDTLISFYTRTHTHTHTRECQITGPMY